MRIQCGDSNVACGLHVRNHPAVFRPYSLTSIAAWTVGSLAGNKAYYEAKARSAAVKNSPAKTPAAARKLHRKLEQIDSEIRSLADELSVLDGPPAKKNITPLIKFLAYSAWFQEAKEQLKLEIRDIYDKTAQQNCVWPSNAVAELHTGVDKRADVMQSACDDLLRQTLTQVPNADVVLNAIREQQRGFNVDPLTFKLLDNREALEAASGKSSAPVTDQELYVACGDQKFGPFCFSEVLELVKAGKVVVTDLVAYEGAPTWVTVEAFIADVNAKSAALLKRR